MVKADGAEVFLHRYPESVPYTEYLRTVPDGLSISPQHTNERYIEVVTDERFCVNVKLLRGFNFMDCPSVRVEIYLDQGRNYLCKTLSRKKPPTAAPDDRSHRETQLFEQAIFVQGQWMRCGLAFGELISGKSWAPLPRRLAVINRFEDEDVALGDKEIAQEVDGIGRIIIKLRRGRFVNKKAAASSEVKSFDPPEHVDTEKSSKEVVHKHNVTHVLKHVDMEPISEEQVQTSGGREWVRAEGDAGKAIVFTIRYRSHAALIALNIIEDDIDDDLDSISSNGDHTRNGSQNGSASRHDDTEGEQLNSNNRATTSSTTGQGPNAPPVLHDAVGAGHPAGIDPAPEGDLGAPDRTMPTRDETSGQHQASQEPSDWRKRGWSMVREHEKDIDERVAEVERHKAGAMDEEETARQEEMVKRMKSVAAESREYLEKN